MNLLNYLQVKNPNQKKQHVSHQTAALGGLEKQPLSIKFSTVIIGLEQSIVFQLKLDLMRTKRENDQKCLIDFQKKCCKFSVDRLVN